MSLFRKLTQRPKSARAETPPAQAGSQGQQITLSEENYGLFEIPDAKAGNEGSADEQSMHQVDIVAVHGLMGHWENTWNAGTSHDDPMFLRDRIPADLSRIGVRARIFSYGYDSAVVFSKSIATIDQAAIMLLSRLLGKRRTSEEKGRPIIFIAHSLGGLVVKQAMIEAWTRNEYYKDILESVKGCLFLGVPHGGADSAYWAKFPARMVSYVTLGLRGNSRILGSLETKSADCVRISRGFVHRATSLQIRTFYETDRLGNVIVVDESSSTMNLPNELALPLLGSNHVTICKFSASENQRYEPVKDALEELVRAGLGTTQKAWDILLRSDMPSRTDTFCGREEELQKMAEALHPETPGKKEKGLVLYGIGGSGKTQLALQYIERYGNPYKAIVWINASNAQDLEATFAEAADLLSKWSDNTAPTSSTATPQKLVVAKLCDARSSPWLLVIDSVDDPNWATQIVKELHGIPLAIEHAGVLIRTFLSPEQFLKSYQERYRWLLEKYPERGILSYDKDRSIITVFDMLFENVKSKYPEAGALLIFLAILGTWKIPTTFLNQYQRFLPEIQSEDDQESQHLVEALSTPEALQFALSHLANACLVKQDSDRDHPYRSNTLHRAIRDWSLRTLLQGKQVWLLQATRGLVAATLNYDEQTTPSLDTLQQRRTLDRAFLAPLKRCVALVHRKVPANQTLPPFGRYCRQYAELVVKLAEINLSCGLLAEADRDFTVAIEYRRTTGVAEWPTSQVDLMLLEGLAVVRYRSADFDSCIEILETALRLAENLYGQFDPEVAAITSYSKEVSEKLERMQQHHKRVVLAGSSTGAAKAKTSGRGTRAGTSNPPSYEEQQTVLAKRQIEENHQLNKDLRTAAYDGSTEKVKLLLAIEGIEPNSKDEQGSTALSWASYKRHEGVVRLLLEVDQIDVNVRDILGRTPHYVFTERGHHKIVQMLLERGAEVNARGGIYGTALKAASIKGHDKIVRMLLEHGADVNAQGGHCDNALQAASTEGHDKVVQMLLEHNADVNAHGGYFGTALQAASTEGHDKVVQMLLEHNADVNAQGGLYNNALEAAFIHGHHKIVQMLLGRGARLTTKPLFFLYTNKITLVSPSLLPFIRIDMVTERDSVYNKTLLHWAADRGDQNVTKRCLDLGADIDATDVLDKTALHYAAGNGHAEIVKTLVHMNADMTILDHQGCTALDCAQEASPSGDRRSYSTIVAYLRGQRRTIGAIYNNTVLSFRRA
ncbi:hypothetical protein KCU78_g2959, partial [Aureobasidium melanogenum]